jgi:hypothetical protein
MVNKEHLTSKGKTEEWAIDCIKHYISASQSSLSNATGSVSSLKDLYKAYNGELSMEHFKTTVNPYNETNQEFTRFPAQIRQFNIIKPLVDKLIGEYLDRPRNFMVTVINSDVESKYKKAEQAKLTEYMTKLVENELAALRGEEPPYQSMPTPKEVKEELANWNDERAVTAQQALDLLLSEINLEDKITLLIKHYVIAGYAVTQRDIFNNTIHWEPKNPIKFWFRGNEESPFIEDTEVQIYKTHKTAMQIISDFGNELTADDIEFLYKGSGGINIIAQIENGIRSTSDMYYNNQETASKGFATSETDVLEVAHVVWKAVCKKGRITTINKEGFEEYTFVDDTYKPSAFEDVEWGYYPEFWEGYCIAGVLYKSIQRLPIVMEAVDNPTDIKSCYNGVVYSNVNTVNKSIVEMAMPYQISYSILKYNLELTLAKNIGTLITLPIDLIPNEDGWNLDKMLYYMKATGFMFVANNDGGNRIQSVVADLLSYVEKQYRICELINEELMELFGFNKPRLGQQTASTGLGLSKEMTYTSSLISEHIFKSLDDLLRKDLNVLLHYTKFAWRNGKKGMMNVSDKERARYSINPADYSDVSLGVVVTNSAKEKDSLNKVKALVEAMANNGADPGMLIEVTKSNNIASLAEKVKVFTKNKQEFEAQQAQQAQQASKEIVDQQTAQSQAKIDSDEKIAFAKMQNDLAIAQMKVQATPIVEDIVEPVVASSNIDELSLLREHLKSEQTKVDQQLVNKELDIKNKAEDVKLQVARENKNKFDSK